MACSYERPPWDGTANERHRLVSHGIQPDGQKKQSLRSLFQTDEDFEQIHWLVFEQINGLVHKIFSEHVSLNEARTNYSIRRNSI